MEKSAENSSSGKPFRPPPLKTEPRSSICKQNLRPEHKLQNYRLSSSVVVREKKHTKPAEKEVITASFPTISFGCFSKKKTYNDATNTNNHKKTDNPKPTNHCKVFFIK